MSSENLGDLVIGFDADLKKLLDAEKKLQAIERKVDAISRTKLEIKPDNTGINQQIVLLDRLRQKAETTRAALLRVAGAGGRPGMGPVNQMHGPQTLFDSLLGNQSQDNLSAELSRGRAVGNRRSSMLARQGAAWSLLDREESPAFSWTTPAQNGRNRLAFRRQMNAWNAAPGFMEPIANAGSMQLGGPGSWLPMGRGSFVPPPATPAAAAAGGGGLMAGVGSAAGRVGGFLRRNLTSGVAMQLMMGGMEVMGKYNAREMLASETNRMSSAGDQAGAYGDFIRTSTTGFGMSGIAARISDATGLTRRVTGFSSFADAASQLHAAQDVDKRAALQRANLNTAFATADSLGLRVDEDGRVNGGRGSALGELSRGVELSGAMNDSLKQEEISMRHGKERMIESARAQAKGMLDQFAAGGQYGRGQMFHDQFMQGASQAIDRTYANQQKAMEERRGQLRKVREMEVSSIRLRAQGRNAEADTNDIWMEWNAAAADPASQQHAMQVAAAKVALRDYQGQQSAVDLNTEVAARQADRAGRSGEAMALRLNRQREIALKGATRQDHKDAINRDFDDQIDWANRQEERARGGFLDDSRRRVRANELRLRGPEEAGRADVMDMMTDFWSGLRGMGDARMMKGSAQQQLSSLRVMEQQLSQAGGYNGRAFSIDPTRVDRSGTNAKLEQQDNLKKLDEVKNAINQVETAIRNLTLGVGA